MKFGVAVTTSVSPAVTATAQAEYVRRVATAAEDVGLDSVWISDRTVFPADLADRYPDMFGPGKADPRAQNVLESLTVLSYVAGMTDSVGLGMSVLVLPFRNPVLNAKMIATLDVLSGGRVIFGVGVGWMPEEYEAMGADYENRGAVTDEHIEIFKAASSQDVPDYQGAHYRMSGMTFFPRPVQQPHPPIWVGGNTSFALRRAAKHGDAWHGLRLSAQQVADGRRKLRSLCESNGRDPDSVAVTLRATLNMANANFTHTSGDAPFTGDPARVLDDVHRYRDAGLEYLVLSVASNDTDGTVDSIRRFADQVLTRVHKG